ncbi:MAG: D-glycerate dehydrogenase [Candidatus Pacebacteria bacterium]|nr:D-glycerate dehydrogenase [Candidatus Paceibacterota bacterium]
MILCIGKNLKKLIQADFDLVFFEKVEDVQEIDFSLVDGIICLVGNKIDKDLIDRCANLKVISTCSVGFDHIDVEYAKEKGIFVTNAPGSNSLSVAEHTVGLMLDISHRISEGDRFMRKGLCKGFEFELLEGNEISRDKVGIIGLGNIGSLVFKMLQNGFNMDVYYYDKDRKPEMEEMGAKYMEFDEIFKTCRFVSINLPLNNNTRHIINRDVLSLMSSDSFLINTSRGGVIDEGVLIEFLKEKRIAGAGLDVFENEKEVNSEFYSLENVVLTPHIAAHSSEAKEMMLKMGMDNIISVLNEGSPINNVY